MELCTRHQSDRSAQPNSLPNSAVHLQTPRASAAPAGGQSCIGRELHITGTITGDLTLESLYVEGRVDGAIELPASRVTIGVNGQVNAGVTACDIVVLGQVLGNLTAAHRIEIRAKARVTGNACAPRVNMEDGADFHGKMLAGVEPEEPAEGRAPKAAVEQPVAASEPARVPRMPVESARRHPQPALQTA